MTKIKFLMFYKKRMFTKTNFFFISTLDNIKIIKLTVIKTN